MTEGQKWLKHGDVAVGDELPPLDHHVSATTVVLGALASRDWRPMHHDHRFAVDHQGTKDIFLNTPNQAAWFERFITDWTGARGRLGRMQFRMHDSVFPDDTMEFRATVSATSVDDASRWGYVHGGDSSYLEPCSTHRGSNHLCRRPTHGVCRTG